MGKLVIDTLRLVQEAERMGASREVAERSAELIAKFVSDAFDGGMTVDEIRAGFGRMARELSDVAPPQARRN